MFYRRDQPGLPAYTVLLTILWLLLAGYILIHPDLYGIIILVVMAIFIAAPSLFIVIGLRRARRHTQQAQDQHGSTDTAASEGYSHNGYHGLNGHLAANANGAQQLRRTDANAISEIPEDGGENP